MMKHTAKFCIGISASLIFGAARAEWTTPTAGELAEECRQDRDTKDGAMHHFALCSVPVKGFVDGYRQGAARGLRIAFVGDPKILATTKGIADVQSRIGTLSARAKCIPDPATTDQVEKVLTNYVDVHPEVANRPYPDVMVDAIEEYFCPR